MAHIQPDTFDLVVVGTGLEEALIAAGAAKSGKTVLHLDQAGQYGSAWSSLTLDDFLTWARQQEELTGLENTQLPDKEGTAEAIDAQDFLHIKFGLAEESLYSNIRLYQQPIDLGSPRHFSLDLAGKVVFCASEAIDTMLAFGVQNYLEFKLFQGSYLYTGGKLTSVPASRAAVFKDRSLSPMDKRLLTRFLMQLGRTVHGSPFPQAAQSSPLVALLKAQGLSPLMRQYVMYAVALADSDQERLSTQQSSSTAHTATAQHQPTARQPPPQSGTTATPDTTTTASPTASSSRSASQTASSQQMEAGTAAENAFAAASLPTSSHPAHEQPHAAASMESASSAHGLPHAPSDTNSCVTPSSEESPSCVASSAPPQSECEHVAVSALSDRLMSVEEGVKALGQYLSSVGRYGPNSGAFLTPMYGCAELPQAFCRVAAVHGAVYILRQPIISLLLDPETRQCKGIQTDTGQVVRCSALAASASALQQLPQAPQPTAGGLQVVQDDVQHTCAKSLSKAICILDGPIQEGEPQLLVTIPPNTAALQNAHAIRVIQVGSAAAVCPANRHLLYMSTPSTATASEDLSQALSALVNTTKAFGSSSISTGSASAALADMPAAAVCIDRRPEALLIAFFTQQCQQDCDSSNRLPPNVACCLPPDGCLDVDSAFRHAKKVFRRLYPDDAAAFEPVAVSGEAESDDEALDALGDVLHNLSTA